MMKILAIERGRIRRGTNLMSQLFLYDRTLFSSVHDSSFGPRHLQCFVGRGLEVSLGVGEFGAGDSESSTSSISIAAVD